MNQNQENSAYHFEELAKKDPLMKEYFIVRNAFLEKYATKAYGPLTKDGDHHCACEEKTRQRKK